MLQVILKEEFIGYIIHWKWDAKSWNNSALSAEIQISVFSTVRAFYSVF